MAITLGYRRTRPGRCAPDPPSANTCAVVRTMAAGSASRAPPIDGRVHGIACESFRAGRRIPAVERSHRPLRRGAARARASSGWHTRRRSLEPRSAGRPSKGRKGRPSQLAPLLAVRL